MDEMGEKLILDIKPFYERILKNFPIPYYITAFLVMVPNFFIHQLLGRIFVVNTFGDFSWFLPLMSGVILILVVWATEHLKWFTEQLYPAFGIEDDHTPVEIISYYLSDKTMIKYGLFFGLLNSGLGLFYGIWYEHTLLFISLLYQIFFVGFIAGLAISGIIGILRVIRYLVSKEVSEVNFNCPDNCAGMVNIGNSLLKFSLVSLLAGILIAYYIFNTPWAHRDWLVVMYFMYAWMGFPHIAAISVLFVPFRNIHLILAKKKYSYLDEIKCQLDDVRRKLLSISESDASTHLYTYEVLSAKHDILISIYSDVEKVNDWPTNPKARTSYAIIYFLSLILPMIEIVKIISELMN